MEIIDTNILCYKFRNPKYSIDIKEKSISSINALEFLKSTKKNHTNSARYYIPLGNILNLHYEIPFSQLHRNRIFNRRLSDSILFDSYFTLPAPSFQAA